MGVIKKFAEWIALKQKLHGNISKAPTFKEGAIWWCSMGENIGREKKNKKRKKIIYLLRC